MNESVEKLDLEAYHLYKNTPGCNRKQRCFLYPVEIYEGFIRLHKKGMHKPIIIVSSMMQYIEKIEKQRRDVA